MHLKEEKQLGELIEAFCFIQRTKPTNSDYFKWMQEYCDKVSFDIFKEQFLHVLFYLQLNAEYKVSNPYYDNIYEFWTKFIKIIHPNIKVKLKEYLLEGFLQLTDHSNETFRYRICESILAILNSEPDFFETLSDEVLQDVRERMLRRVKDVNLGIKLKAIEIIKYVQNVEDTDDLIIDVLIENLTNSVVKIRLASIESIAPVPKSIKPLINRVRDVSENVRINTCKKFASIPAQYLTIVERHTLLRNALKDFSEEVPKCIENEVLPWWLTCYNDNYIELSNALLLDGNDSEIKETKKLIEKVLKTLFKSQSILSMLEELKFNNKLLDETDLNWLQVLFWRCLIQHFSGHEEGQYLEQILPETNDFCQYLYNYYETNKDKSLSKWERKQFQLVLEELIQISLACDISDECNRVTHRQTMLRLLAGDVSTDVIATIFTYICQMMPDFRKRITFICEFISDLKTSCESKFDAQVYAEYEEKTKNMKKEINKLLDEQRIAVSELDLQKADSLKTEIEKLKQELQILNDTMSQEEQTENKNDQFTILKCANIVIELLQSPQIIKLNSALKTLSEEMLKDLAFVTDVKIQATVMKCYAMLCSLDKNASISCLKLFTPILISYRDMTSEIDKCILIMLIVCITDIILIWGENVFPKEEEEDLDTSGTLDSMFSSLSYKETIQIIVSMMDNKAMAEVQNNYHNNYFPLQYNFKSNKIQQNDLVREMSGIAITKMLDLDCIRSALLLSRLILKWFNPLTAEKDPKLHQYLGIFLSNFNRESHAEEQYIETIIPTVVAITTAPTNSPLSSLPTDTLIKFLIQVTSPQVTQNDELHKKIAKILCTEINKDINNIKCNLLYSKALTYLDIYNGDTDFINSMLDICEDIIIEIESAHNSIAMKRNVQKCIYLLNNTKSEDTTKSEDRCL